MPNKMERFTQRARQALTFAQQEAEQLEHNFIGTEHLLLGLMRDEGGVAGRVLRELGLDLAQLRETVTQLTQASQRQPNQQLDLGADTKKALEWGVDEARRMGHHYIGTEHLMLGVVRQSKSTAVDILKQLGISSEEVRRQTLRVLQEPPVAAGQPRLDVGVRTFSRQFRILLTDKATSAVIADIKIPLDAMSSFLQGNGDFLRAEDDKINVEISIIEASDS